MSDKKVIEWDEETSLPDPRAYSDDNEVEESGKSEPVKEHDWGGQDGTEREPDFWDKFWSKYA